MTGLGTVVIEGRGYGIDRIVLRGGELVITASGIATARTRQADDVPAAVFGQDGRGICQGWKTHMPELNPGEHVTIFLPIRIASLEDE